MNIRVEQSFILYAHCSVEYNGRAKSTLIPGNYLITHKNDGTLRIDGGSLCTPLNYQPPGAILYKQPSGLISKRKKETIIINLEKIYHYQELQDWSTNKIDITKTEANLRDKLAADIHKIINANFIEVFKEFKTPFGVIDILAIDNQGIYHVVEVKRARSTLSTCSQVSRYCQYFNDIMMNVKGYIASPEISKNALKYANQHSQTYLKVDHEATA